MRTKSGRGPVADDRATVGERAAEFIGHVLGSWLYVFSIGLGFGAWIAHNVLSGHPFGPWPCIVLGLIISIATYLQESIMMMAQNRASRQVELLAIDTNRRLAEAQDAIEEARDAARSAEVLQTFTLRLLLAAVKERPSDGPPPGPDGVTF